MQPTLMTCTASLCLAIFLFDGQQRLSRAGRAAASARADVNHGTGFAASDERLLKGFAQKQQVVEGIELGHGAFSLSQPSDFTR
jgi:hypothetical protein